MRGRWIVALCILAAACGSAGHGRTATYTPAPGLDGCVHPGPGVQLVALTGSGDPDAAILGHGARSAVLSNESDQNLCAWLPFARFLERAGIRVLVTDSSTTSDDAVLQGAQALRHDGARRVVAIGASVGARASLVAAAHARGRLDGVVSLSAERLGRAVRPDIRPAVARLRLPALFVATRHDPYAEGDAPVLYRAARSRVKRLVVLPGAAHGTAMLKRARVRALVLRFMRTV